MERAGCAKVTHPYPPEAAVVAAMSAVAERAKAANLETLAAEQARAAGEKESAVGAAAEAASKTAVVAAGVARAWRAEVTAAGQKEVAAGAGADTRPLFSST